MTLSLCGWGGGFKVILTILLDATIAIFIVFIVVVVVVVVCSCCCCYCCCCCCCCLFLLLLLLLTVHPCSRWGLTCKVRFYNILKWFKLNWRRGSCNAALRKLYPSSFLTNFIKLWVDLKVHIEPKKYCSWGHEKNYKPGTIKISWEKRTWSQNSGESGKLYPPPHIRSPKNIFLYILERSTYGYSF